MVRASANPLGQGEASGRSATAAHCDWRLGPGAPPCLRTRDSRPTTKVTARHESFAR